MRPFIKLFGIVFGLSFLSGCGLGSVHNLHFHDRIPHETQKGYVVLSSTWQAEPGMENVTDLFQEHGIIFYRIYKKEFNHKVPITGIGGMSPGNSSPVTVLPGDHIFIIEYPFASGFGGMDEEVFKEVMGEAASGTIKFSDQTILYYTKIMPMEIQVNIQKDHTTHIMLHGHFKIYSKGDAKYGPYLTLLNTNLGKPVQTVVTGFEILEGANGPRVYNGNYNEIYGKTREAINTLGWEIENADESKGVISVTIKRFAANSFSFTIGVNDLGNGHIQVNVSSNSGWQRWGSINTGMSLDKINELYGKIDSLMLH